MSIAFDATARTYDKDGRLHISRSHISKACVNPYYGREIPGSQHLGLEQDKIYYLFRSPEELEKAAPTFARLPILKKHVPVSAEAPRQDLIVGTIGSDVEFLAPYLDGDVSIWDNEAIAGIKTDKIREFSCAYHYVPIMSPGKNNGERYDGIMTQIQGNHLALVESGRAGSDVLAADTAIVRESTMAMTKLGNAIKVALTTAFKNVKIAQDSDLEKMLATAERGKFDTAKAVTLVIAMDAEAGPGAKIVMDALVDVDEPKPAKDCKECGAKDGVKHGKDCKIGKDEAEEDDEKEKKAAKDAEEKDKDDKKAMDEKIKLATDSIRRDMREAEEARRAVRSVVGDVVAQDSAAEIYGFALDHLKVDRAGVEGVPALRALFNAASKSTGVVPAVIAQDTKGAETMFPGITRFGRA